MKRWTFFVSWFVFTCSAQQPSFQANRVQAGDHPVPLAPGLLLSIYGTNLGPPTGCQGQADQQRRETPSPLRPRQAFVETLIYPQQLCDTQVLVGGIPAGLLYVSDTQINFKVPQEVRTTGTTELQVIYKGHSSPAVKLPLGLDSAVLSLESPAKIGGPVWLKVSLASTLSLIRYPIQVWPASFGCHQIEVRKDGKLLSPVATLETQALHGIAMGGAGPCGLVGLPADSQHMGRLPLHLRYRFELPGTYEVRYSFRSDFPGNAPPEFSSPWTEIQILPGTPTERSQWLTEVSRHPPSDAVSLLTDFLPEILGIPDEQSLQLLCEYLYHPDNLVRQFAMYGLTYWPANMAKASVRKAAQARDLSDVVTQFLDGDGDFLVNTAIRFFHSDSSLLLSGAVRALSRMGNSVSPELRIRGEAALIRNAERVVNTADNQTLIDYAAALGTVHNDQARSLLWNFVDRNIARSQSLIALTWIHSPADLQRLAQQALTPANGHNLDYDMANLPYALYQGYGEAALPYLETMLRRSEFTWVRTNCARELIVAGRSAGFAFLVDAIENNRPYRQEMIQFLRDRFPDLRQADVPAVLTFAKERQ